MQILTVPQGLPQTKPRALELCPPFASPAILWPYSTPRMFRTAPIASGGGKICSVNCRSGLCVQRALCALGNLGGVKRVRHLAIIFLTRQFTLEYAALFEAILPALQRLGLPILLGGTSNHFRRATHSMPPVLGMRYNVTEDADLGVRLARGGKRVAMLDSDTWEEAPATPRAWLGQRTRWLKGWMQTYLVHMRRPRQFFGELGPWRFLGLQIMLGGMILSALVHPWFYLSRSVETRDGPPGFSAAGGLWALCWFNVAAGYAAGIVLGLNCCLAQPRAGVVVLGIVRAGLLAGDLCGQLPGALRVLLAAILLGKDAARGPAAVTDDRRRLVVSNKFDF